MGTLVEFRTSAHEQSTLAFSNGFVDGRTARAIKGRLTPYLEIGIDDYARGFRAGFFAQENPPRTLVEG